MSTDRDPLLEELFAAPPALNASEPFCTRTIELIARQGRRRRLVRLGAEITVLVVAWIVSEPLQALAAELMPWIMTSLVDAGDSALSQLLAPLNSIAGVIALLFLLGGAFYRRLFRT